MIGQPRGSRWVVPVIVVAIAVLGLVGLRHARPGPAAGPVQPTRSWEAMIDAGDASLRIGRVSGTRMPSEARARQAYLAALFRARAERSIEGVLRAAEAFAQLGDDEVVARGITIARRLVAQAPAGAPGARLEEVEARLAARLLEVKRGQADRF